MKYIKNLSYLFSFRLIIFLTFFLSFVFLGNTLVFAKDYYVSPTGNATWPNCTTATNPCQASNTSKSFLNAAAGDTVYFLNGTYLGLTYNESSYNVPSWNPYKSGTSGNPIIFRSLNKHGAHLIGYNNQGTKRVPIIGANGRNFIIWDGFILSAVDTQNNPVMASAYFYNSDNSIVRNCDIRGASHSTGGAMNYEGVRIEQSNHVLVENNLIHGFIETSNNHNTSGVKLYYNTNITFKNNEIFNNTAGVYIKRDNDQTIIRNNYIHHNYIGEYASGNGVSSHGISHINNVFANNKIGNIEIIGDSSTVDMDNLIFVNNTFFGSSPSISIRGSSNYGEPAVIYNNIFYGSSTIIRTVYDYSKIKESDHNNLGNFSNITIYDYQNKLTFTSLAAWKGSKVLSGGGSPGAGSIATNPLFVNNSKNFSQLSDFSLASNSPCIGAGRNGANMGADISQIGVLGVQEPSPAKLSTPRGFSIK